MIQLTMSLFRVKSDGDSAISEMFTLKEVKKERGHVVCPENARGDFL